LLVRLRAAEARYFFQFQVEVIPVPAALPLFVSALAGFGFLGIRQKRKSRKN